MYNKFILTVIAIGLIGINFHLVRDTFNSKANAGIQGQGANWIYMSNTDLYFRTAVKSIVEECGVNGSKLRC